MLWQQAITYVLHLAMTGINTCSRLLIWRVIKAISCLPQHRNSLIIWRFPLGHMTKPEVRELADQFGLEIASKPDSQDICFVPDGDYARVIGKLRPDAAQSGDIVHLDGRVLGQHDGIINFTIGQRRGLGVANR